MKKLQSIQPKMKAIQEKYKGKSGDARKMSSETMGLYRSWSKSYRMSRSNDNSNATMIGLYRAIVQTMPSTKRNSEIINSIYSWNPAISVVPFDSEFLGILLVDLVSSAYFPWNYLLPVLVGVNVCTAKNDNKSYV